MSKFSKFIVSFVILANCLFAMAILYIFWRTGDEPDTLIKYWFIFTGTELLGLASIKVVKTVRDKKRCDIDAN